MVIPIFERWGLNPREQRVATVATLILGAFVVLGIPVGLQTLVSSRKAENEELRVALTDVNNARAKIRDRQEKKTTIAARYSKRAPQLSSFLGEMANTQKLQVAESTDRPDVPHGKKYTERHTVVKLKKSGMGPIAKMLESIEKSSYPVAVSRLNVRKRSGEPDSYDVEIGVSAFDRNEAAPAGDKDKEKEKK